MEADQDKRKKLVWEIERRLAEDVARPVLYHNRSGTCWQPYVKGYAPMVNSIYNGCAWKTSGSTSSRDEDLSASRHVSSPAISRGCVVACPAGGISLCRCPPGREVLA